MSLENRNISRREIRKANKKIKNKLEYIDSRSEALLLTTTKSSRMLIWFSFLFVIAMIAWMYYSQIDQLVRGMGRVIPSQKIQYINNLEGGIVSEILVKEGDSVKVNDTLIKLDKKNFVSKEEENTLKIYELRARIKRLEAEAKGRNFVVKRGVLKEKMQQEKRLYLANKKEREQEISILKQQLFQKQNQLSEKRDKLMHLQDTLTLTQDEVDMKRNLLAERIGSRSELNLAEQKLSSIEGEYSSTDMAIPRLESAIRETKAQIQQVRVKFRKNAVEELNQAKDELARLRKVNVAKKDRVARTTLYSPVTGIVQRILVNTIGGVVKSGESIMEIVPSNDTLIISTKIRPSDIAFIHPNQKAVVRFSAYDFAIYGSLEAKVINISADTITDEIDRKNYYQVKIKTEKNYLGEDNTKLKIMPGMIATVDIVSGKKSVLNYILKPILRAKQNVLSQR